MSYARHTALDLSLAASQVVSSIPASDELLILTYGTVTSGGASDLHMLRPNSDSGANYSNIALYENTQSQQGVQAGLTSGLFLSRGGNGSDVQSTHRLTKRGNHWSMAGQQIGKGSGVVTGEVGMSYGAWNGGGVAIATLQFRWDVTTAAARFTGRVEVWYRDA